MAVCGDGIVIVVVIDNRLEVRGPLSAVGPALYMEYKFGNTAVGTHGAWRHKPLSRAKKACP